LKLWILLAFAALSLSAQIGGTGTIKGTVIDPSGAVVPGAAVSATHVLTGVESRREATSAGLFVIAPLSAGTYKVAATAPGFRTVVQEQIIVDALGTVELTLKLDVGATAESVTVTAAPPELNTNDARMGQTIRNEMYTALPLAMGNGNPRNPAAFIYLMPGVQEGGTFGFINGGQSFSKDVYIEGLPITDAVRQGESRALQFAVSVESIEQFQVETSGQSVEFNGQGSENYQVKSGTNQFHGAVYEYFRNTKLDARGFFNATRPQQNQNQYGYTFGGPLKRNKLFFFTAYDGYKYRVATAAQFVTIPTTRMRTGDFGEFTTGVFDPASTNCPGGVNCARQVFPGNVIPASRISPISKFFQDPLPATTHPGIVSNFLNNNKGVGFDNFNFTAKTDWNVSDAHKFTVLFTRGSHDQSSAIRGNPVPLPLPYTVTRFVAEVPTVGQLKHNWVINSSMLNQISYGVSRLNVPITNPTIGGRWVEKSGLKGLPPGDATLSFPEVSFGGVNSPASWRGTDARPFLDALNTFSLQDNFQWIKSKHAFKAGLQHQRLQDNYRARIDGTLFIANFSNAQTAGFTNGALNNATGNSYASYLLGNLSGATVTEDSVVTSGARFRNYSWWVGDDWKVSKNLTLNIGLRHDIMLPYVEVVDRASWFNPDIPNPLVSGFKGALQFGGKGNDPLYCNCSTRIKTHWNNWGPRIGFAYRVNDKTVVRSGYGVMYSRHGAVGGRGGAREGTGKLGYTAAPGFVPVDTFSPAFNWENGIPAYQKPPFFDSTLNTGFFTERATGGGVAWDNPEEGARPPRYQNWNFSVQHAVTPSITVTAGYVGGNGKLLRGGGKGIWSGEIRPENLALGNLLTAQVTATTLASARAIIPSISLPYPNFRGTFAQMLRPFPQYSGVNTDFVNLASSNYNSMQLTVAKRMANGLTFNLNHTWSKTISDAGAGRSAYFWQQEKTHGESDRRHVFNVMLVYQLPWSKDPNRMVRMLAGGWRVSSITRIRSGNPYGIIGAACTLPNAGGCRASYNPSFNGSVRINGEWGTGDLIGARPIFLDRTAFVNPAPYTYGNTPGAGAYGLYGPGFWNEDATLNRTFTITERFKADLAVEAFNVTNTPLFNGPASLDINNANFGRITSQQNTPRSLQLGLKISF
jgi:hypothetical protein